MNSQISMSRNDISIFCRKHGVRSLAIFGSAVREDFGPDSDIDLLVDFEIDRTPRLTVLAEMERELSGTFGRGVDLVRRSAVERSRNHIRRRAILESAEEIYAR